MPKLALFESISQQLGHWRHSVVELPTIPSAPNRAPDSFESHSRGSYVTVDVLHTLSTQTARYAPSVVLLR